MKKTDRPSVREEVGQLEPLHTAGGGGCQPARAAWKAPCAGVSYRWTIKSTPQRTHDRNTRGATGRAQEHAHGSITPTGPKLATPSVYQ